MAARGSSPRARGTVRVGLSDIFTPRFIPARAGNGTGTHPSSDPAPVHPRARGERRTVQGVRQAGHGSSPRARGTAVATTDDLLARRFIPARAGNGSTCQVTGSVRTVHPRARGERPHPKAMRSRLAGSSPRARGTDHSGVPTEHLGRFIPARAGNGCLSHSSRPPASVHPRARGERVLCWRMSELLLGSSPRARGTVVLQRSDGCQPRFIPARAGNGP